MSIGDIFENVSKGIAGAVKVAGRAAEEFQPELQSALLGNAGEVAADKRHEMITIRPADNCSRIRCLLMD